MSIVSLIYNIVFIPIASIIILLLKPFNKKLKERETNWKSSLQALDQLDYSKPRIWFHSASMGEFEQAKPVIEEIKRQNSNMQIVVSFFSPSGYVNQKNYELADAVIYLPFDTLQNARILISKIKPLAVAFVRYEIWRNYIELLYKKRIPVYLICATVPGSRALRTFPFFKAFSKSSYSFFTRIFTVGDYHSRFFASIVDPEKVETMTDTRFDRIVQNVTLATKNPIVPRELFYEDDFILVAGSSWKPDEDIIISVINDFYKQNRFQIRLIIVPHEPEHSTISRLKALLPNSILLSELMDLLENKDFLITKEMFNRKHIIVDSIGKLLQLYSIAAAAYIGGGFGAGIHSVTEPAGYGIPLCTGPGISNSHDAIELEKMNALTTIENIEDFSEWLTRIIIDEKLRSLAGRTAMEYVHELTGSSKKIASILLS